MKHHLLAGLILLLCVGGVLAQDDQGNPNDPFINENANACFAGGSLESLCAKTDADLDGDVDQSDIDFMWWCGWYIIRAEKGILTAGNYPPECFYEQQLADLCAAAIRTGLFEYLSTLPGDQAFAAFTEFAEQYVSKYEDMIDDLEDIEDGLYEEAVRAVLEMFVNDMNTFFNNRINSGDCAKFTFYVEFDIEDIFPIDEGGCECEE